MKVFLRNFLCILIVLVVLVAAMGFIGAGLYLAGSVVLQLPWRTFLISMVLFSAAIAGISTILNPKG